MTMWKELPLTEEKKQKRVISISQVVDKKAAVRRCKEKLLKLDVQAMNKEENKQIALGTSKVSYLDPRITVAW